MADIELFFPFKNIGFVKWDHDFSFMYNLDFLGICGVLSFQSIPRAATRFGLAVFKGVFSSYPSLCSANYVPLCLGAMIAFF